MHEVLVNRLGGRSLPRKSVVRLTDYPDLTTDVYQEQRDTHARVLYSWRRSLGIYRIYSATRRGFPPQNDYK